MRYWLWLWCQGRGCDDRCSTLSSSAMVRLWLYRRGNGDGMNTQSHWYTKPCLTLSGKSGLSSLCIYSPQKHPHALSSTTSVSVNSFIQTERLLIWIWGGMFPPPTAHISALWAVAPFKMENGDVFSSCKKKQQKKTRMSLATPFLHHPFVMS